MVVGAKVCELTDDFLWFVCGNFDVSPKKSPLFSGPHHLLLVYSPAVQVLEYKIVYTQFKHPHMTHTCVT